MQVELKLREFWSKNLERGDISLLSKNIGVSHSKISRIVKGETEKASSDIVLKINELAKKRKLMAKKAQAIDID